MTPDQRAVIQAAVEDFAEAASKFDRLAGFFAFSLRDTDRQGLLIARGAMHGAAASRDRLAKLLEDGDG